jgi:hypothetical protein
MRRGVYVVLISLAIAVIGFYVYTKAANGTNSSPTITAAIEKQRGEGTVSYLIHEHAVPDGVVAFFLRNMPNHGINVGAEYVRKTSNGWKWGYGGSFGASNVQLGLTDTDARKETFHAEYFLSTEGTEFGKTPFPMIYGVVLNPDINRMTVKDYLTGLEKQAEIVELERNFKLFYVFVDKTQGMKFDITGYAKDGEVVHKEISDKSQLKNMTVHD